MPTIIKLLIKGTDTPRANIARMAVETAQHVCTHNRHPSLPADLIHIRKVIPGANYASLIAPLPVPDDYKTEILLAVASDKPGLAEKGRP